MSFSMKPQTADLGQGSGDNTGPSESEWKAWNDYLYSLVEEEETEVKKGKFVKSKTLVGILNFIMDMGFQPQKDAEYDTKCALPEEGEDNSQEELDHIEKWPTNYFAWVEDKGVMKRKQFSPQNPEQEYAFFYDFPEIMVDWTKHPAEHMHKLGQKPLRISYNGRFGKMDSLHFAKTLPFRLDYKSKTLGTKNPIYKIADKSGVLKQFVSSGYDLGVLAGSACKWNVEFGRNVVGDKVFYNNHLKDPSKIEDVKAGSVVVTRAQQIPECEVGFVGVGLNDKVYDPDTLEYIKARKELVAVVSRATSFKPSPVKWPDFVLGVDFAGTALAKALSGGTEEQAAPPKSKEAPQQSGRTEEYGDSDAPDGCQDDFDDFDNTIPF